MTDDEALDGAVKVPESEIVEETTDFDRRFGNALLRQTLNESVSADLAASTRNAIERIERLEQMVLERDALVLERDQEIDKLLIEAVVLREKQDRHDKVLAEKENQIAWDKHEIRRLTDMTRKWWQK